MDLKLKDKIALVTGGSQGIGLRTAWTLADEGCHVAICARGQDALDAATEQIKARGVNVAAIQGDVTRADDAQRIIDEATTQLGGLDILINNVGGMVGGSLLESTDEDWKQTFDINVFAAVRLTRLAVPVMKGRPGASIVNVSSISGWSPQLAGRGQYGSSKAAIIFMTEVLALELVEAGIRMNTVSPGSIIWDGGSWDRLRKNEPEAFAAYERDGFPMGRLGSPEEVADVITFLASPRANWINGRHIPVDGLEQPIPLSLW